MDFSDKVALWRRVENAARVAISFEFYVEISCLNRYERVSQIANLLLRGLYK